MHKYQILKDLVAFDTIKDKENEAIINYIEKFLLNQGFKTEHKSKNLVMKIGNNPKLGFLGHTDTVEYIDGWGSNPHEITLKDGNIYGLGTCDMKGGIAAMLQAVSETDFSKMKNGMKLYFTYNEEIAFGGVYDLIKSKERFPETMIFGEPTNNEILVGGKGFLEYELDFVGIKAHSSNPAKGKSANLNAIKFLSKLDEFYSNEIRIFEDENYEIPYTTMNIGIINGGSAMNSVAASCKVKMDFRIIDNNHIDKIKKKVEELAEIYECKIKIIDCFDAYINETDLTTEKKTANFLTEASAVKNIKKAILGPGPMTPHEVNEHISEESYNKLVRQYKEIIQKKCKG